MYYVQKTIEISAAHNLMLSYESKCEVLHGHNWIIVVYCKSETLNSDGMVTDFTHIKRIVKDTFDHKYINDILDVNPSAENIASGFATMYRTATWFPSKNPKATLLSMRNSICQKPIK